MSWRRTALFTLLVQAAAPTLGGGDGRALARDLFEDLDRLGAELAAKDPALRRAAAERLEALEPRLALPLVEQALNDHDLEVRIRALQVAGRLRLDPLLSTLLGKLNDPEPRLRAAAALSVGLVSGGDARPRAALERVLVDTDPEVRAAALQAFGSLRQSGEPGVESLLAARLDDESAAVRQRAALLLGRLGGRGVAVFLLGHTSDPAREVRLAVAEALAKVGDPRATPALVRLLADPAEEVQRAAIDALGALGARSAIAPLSKLLSGDGASLRGRAAVALGRIARAPAEPSDERAPSAGRSQALAALLGALPREETRPAAVEGLRVAGPSAVSLLAERLPLASGEELSALLILLERSPTPSAFAALADELRRDRGIRDPVLAALAALCRAGDPRPLPLLLSELESAPFPRRKELLRLIAGATDARATEVLLAQAQEPDPELQLLALGEMSRLRIPETRPLLLTLSGSPHAEVAAAAARGLGALGDRLPAAEVEPVARTLVALLASESPLVRRAATDALGQLRPPLRDLERLVVPRLTARNATTTLVVGVGQLYRGRPTVAVRERLLGLAESAPGSIGRAAVDALAALGDGAAAARLVTLLGQRPPAELRARLVAALGVLPSPPVAVLVDRLEHDADPRVRAEAAWSLGRSAAAQDPTVRSALVRGLNSTVGAVRIHCAAGLVRAPRGLVSWSDLREDALVGVRAAATAALSGSPAPTESRALLVGDEHPFVRRAAQSASEAPSASSDWSVLHLLDRDGNPLPGAWALLSLPGGLPRVVQSDSEGSVRLEGVPRGEILIELLDREP